eukprot:353932-Chlamydomonas_euryale.AAC.2
MCDRSPEVAHMRTPWRPTARVSPQVYTMTESEGARGGAGAAAPSRTTSFPQNTYVTTTVHACMPRLAHGTRHTPP